MWTRSAVVLLLSLGCTASPAQPTPVPTALVAAPQPTVARPTALPAATAIPPTPTVPPVPTATVMTAVRYEVQEFNVPRGSRPHDVAPAPDGGVWFTAQGSGHLGWLNPANGETRLTALGNGSAPHGVIVGPDGAAWITDGGLNAIVRVDPASQAVKVFPLPANRRSSNLNTATFDQKGMLWFTGQSGIHGRLDPANGQMTVWDSPRGSGPYGINTAPDGSVYYSSLAGSYLGKIDVNTGEVQVLEPPSARQGARRVWADSKSNIWISEWNSGQVSRYTPSSGQWQAWKLPGNRPQTYSVYVDDRDQVWLTEFTGDTIVRFDPATEQFESFPMTGRPANVRQMLGRPGEVWGAESGSDKLGACPIFLGMPGIDMGPRGQ